MFNLLITESERPSKVNVTKNDDYHLRMGRYYLSRCSNSAYQENIYRSLVCWNFYKGKQWIFNDDLENFLMDESGEVRNRIRFVENIIKPMVRMLKNNAIKVNFEYHVEAINPKAIVRREEELTKALAMQDVAQMVGGDFKEMVQANFPVGEEDYETETLFDDTFQDQYITGMNYLIGFVADINDFEDKKVQIAEKLAVDGCGILKAYHQSGHQRWKIIPFQNFIWDTGAQKPDLQDSEMMGDWSLELPEDIRERWPNLKAKDAEALDNFVRTYNHGNFSFLTQVIGQTGARVPVVELHWKDTERQEWGWVLDDSNIPMFIRVNCSHNKYKTKDCFKPKDKKLQEGLNKDNIMIRYPSVVRFCTFIPQEYVPSPITKRDIILEWGVREYSEEDLMSPLDNVYPYKVAMFSYVNGEVYSPIYDSIDPQRLVNRLNSMAESEINNSRGSGTIIDSTYVDADGGEEEIQRSINLNKTVFLRANGQLNNAVGSYDSTIRSGTEIKFDIADRIKANTRNNIGINDAMTGTNGGRRELNGVTNAMLQQGSLMQEDFYYAISNCLKQVYQCILTQGKLIYVNNPNILVRSVGENYAKPLIITKDYLPEQFRAFVKRTISNDESRQAVNSWIFQLLQLGLLDPDRASKLFNTDSMDDVKAAMIEFQKEQKLMKQQAMQADMAAQQQQQQMPLTQQAGQQQFQAQENQKDREAKLQETLLTQTLENGRQQ